LVNVRKSFTRKIFWKMIIKANWRVPIKYLSQQSRDYFSRKPRYDNLIRFLLWTFQPRFWDRSDETRFPPSVKAYTLVKRLCRIDSPRDKLFSGPSSRKESKFFAQNLFSIIFFVARSSQACNFRLVTKGRNYVCERHRLLSLIHLWVILKDAKYHVKRELPSLSLFTYVH
jgi:hypothetical protein